MCHCRPRVLVRGCLDIPIAAQANAFRWLVWVRVSRDDFLDMCDRWYDIGREATPAYVGELDSALPGYPETRGLSVAVRTQPIGERAQVVVLPNRDHALALEQSGGITWDEAQRRSASLLHGHAAA